MEFEIKVSTHSRLKAAGVYQAGMLGYQDVSTHSRLKAAGFSQALALVVLWFQHTAA